jgi:hypothetical protein
MSGRELPRRKFRIVRAKDEQLLRDVIHRLFDHGYNMGDVSGIVLDAMGCRDLLDDSRAASEERAAVAQDAAKDPLPSA